MTSVEKFDHHGVEVVVRIVEGPSGSRSIEGEKGVPVCSGCNGSLQEVNGCLSDAESLIADKSAGHEKRLCAEIQAMCARLGQASIIADLLRENGSQS
jgi:hypothetical protein